MLQIGWRGLFSCLGLSFGGGSGVAHAQVDDGRTITVLMVSLLVIFVALIAALDQSRRTFLLMPLGALAGATFVWLRLDPAYLTLPNSASILALTVLGIGIGFTIQMVVRGTNSNNTTHRV